MGKADPQRQAEMAKKTQTPPPLPDAFPPGFSPPAPPPPPPAAPLDATEAFVPLQIRTEKSTRAGVNSTPKTPALPPGTATPQPAIPAPQKRPLSPARALVAPAHIAVAIPSEDEAPDLTNATLKSAPPFLISMVVHMLLIIGLALVTFSEVVKDQLQLQAVYTDNAGQQLLDNSPLQSPDGLNMEVESPALSFGLTAVNDPLAAPTRLPDFFGGASTSNATIEAPNIGFALTGRESGKKKALSAIYGASAGTENAVVAGLEWLKRQQMRDGGWSLTGPYSEGASNENRCAATAMALLAFQGYGATHVAGVTTPDFHDSVERGWNYLLKTQDKDGFFQHDGVSNHRMYAQGQATIAICEIYGMTKDPKFKRSAQLALDWAHKAQDPKLGGWRYQPQVDSDTSVTGWYVMAFQSGLMAGLEVQSPNLELVNRFLDQVQSDGGSQYTYQIGEPPRLTMTAEALLCRQYLGWKHDDPRLRAGVDQILANRINYQDDMNVYYWYYATQVCHHMDGDDWNRWNEIMRQAVPTAQTKAGTDRGSWTSSGDRWGTHGGRLFSTCLSVFMLETYYRHLPIYKWRLK